ERLALRAEIVRRGPLVRELLEGEDIDLVEAASRLMLNLHGTATGVPLGTRMRGPMAHVELMPPASDQDVGEANVQTAPSPSASASGLLRCSSGSSSGLPSPTSSPSSAEKSNRESWNWASAWCGVWEGEMCYARGGERHAALRLVLHSAAEPGSGDPGAWGSRQQAEEALRVEVEEACRISGGAAASSQGSPSQSGRSGANGRVPVRAGANAEYWHFFGFLADSDFDCASETVKYVDEQIRRRRQPSSPSHTGPVKSPHSAKVPTLVGAGWDEQNGLFTAEAQLWLPRGL
ncbi:unnamed protein product, partial [Polarella glacialis]